jgi:hypothetical protein
VQREHVTIAPRSTATERFIARLDEAFPDTVFVGCRNWYSDQTGTPILWPLPQDAHEAFFAKVAWGDFEVKSIPRHRDDSKIEQAST